MKTCCRKSQNELLPKKGEKPFSSFFYVLRGMAIISVVYAHSISLENVSLQRAGTLIGVIGVPLFLIASGFFFNATSFIRMIKNTTVSIVVPWLIWGTLSFTLSVFLGGSASLTKYLEYLLGHKTWLYFVPVLVVLRYLFFFLRGDIVLMLAVVISLVSSISSYYPPQHFGIHCNAITPFQNPLNWCGYYALSILLNRHRLLNKLLKVKWMVKLVIVFCWFSVAVMMIEGTDKINYWHPLSVLFIYLSIPLACFLAVFWEETRWLYCLGKNSYLLYFLHMQLGIAAANIVCLRLLPSPWAIFALKPFIVLAITMILVLFIKMFLQRLKLVRYSKYIGIAMPIGR